MVIVNLFGVGTCMPIAVARACASSRGVRFHAILLVRVSGVKHGSEELACLLSAIKYHAAVIRVMQALKAPGRVGLDAPIR